MTETLILALVDKNALDKDTIITADYQLIDLFGRVFIKQGDFKLRRIIQQSNKPILELTLLNGTNSIIKVDSNNIKAIDGMNIFRFADMHNLFPDGSNKKIGKKRGRKSKNQLSV